MTGSTSLIHRYLPESASKILIYYLWLVHPFQRQLRTLALQDRVPISPFLWPGESGFTSDRLSKALRREFRECLDIDIALADYRHVTNAISRRQLRVRGFQREYKIPVHRDDLQASHTTWTSSMMYARPQNGAPSHLEARRWEYRVVSRGWHHLLGFTDNSIPHVQAISQVIGCEAYFKDQIDRTGVLERFYQTPSAVIAATSALGMGVDSSIWSCRWKAKAVGHG